MAQAPNTARRVAPYVLSGASSLHILARLWRLSRLPASTIPLHVFLLEHTDVILVISSGPIVIWHLAKRHYQRSTPGAPLSSHSIMTFLPEVAHQLRQVFTALLLGLGLIKRKAAAGKTAEVPRLVERLNNVISKGVKIVNELDPVDTLNGHELC